MELNEYLKLKKQTERLQREQDEAKGRLKQLMADLESNYGCQTLSQAKKLLKKFKRRERNAEREVRRRLAEVKEATAKGRREV